MSRYEFYLSIYDSSVVVQKGGSKYLLIRPPGSGKSMLARSIPTIMPPMSLKEAIETTKIHSVCGLLPSGEPVLRRRPFRDPHTISNIGLLGGTANITPRRGQRWQLFMRSGCNQLS